VQDWLDHSLVINLRGSILLVGFIQELLKYAAVRYGVFPLPEFDEWTDGILYGTAAGLGFATVLNIQYVVDSGGVDLGMGVIRIVVTALAQASFAGIIGYFLGRAKFEDEPVWWLPLGLTIAAVLNGLFTVVRGSVTRSGSALAGQTANPGTASSWQQLWPGWCSRPSCTWCSAPSGSRSPPGRAAVPGGMAAPCPAASQSNQALWRRPRAQARRDGRRRAAGTAGPTGR